MNYEMQNKNIWNKNLPEIASVIPVKKTMPSLLELISYRAGPLGLSTFPGTKLLFSTPSPIKCWVSNPQTRGMGSPS